MVILNVDGPPIKQTHISYYTKDRGINIELLEVFEAYYPHPQAPKEAIVQRLETRSLGVFHRNSIDGSSSVLLEAAQRNVHQSMPTK